MSKYARLIASSDINNVLCGISCDSLVLTFVDKTHIEMLRLFVLFWRKHELNNLIIVCLDKETITYVKGARLNGIHVPYSITSRHKFWRIRTDIINLIFKLTKKNIIHTDVDCFWFKNIIPKLESDQADVYYSTANGFPEEIRRRHGFVLCCGFYFVKYNERTKTYFDNMLLHAATQDDQVLSNNYVFETATQIHTTPNEELSRMVILLKSNVTVCAIKNEIIPRSPDLATSTKCQLFHPYLSGSSTEKVTAFANYVLPRL